MVELAKKEFDDFYLSSEMLQALDKVDYVKPTPCQEASIPLVMAGIDLIVQAQTGTGKTAAFAIPIIEMLDPKPGRVDVLVLAPTRELARQVSGEFERLGQFKDIDVATIYGGSSYERQYDALETASIVTATPGRLLDLLNRGKLDLSRLEIFGLDEADEMLSMGFAEELDAIMEFLPEERQSLLFSATITEEVKALANTMLYYPEYVSLSEDNVAADDVEHYYYNVRGVGRARDLLRVLEYENPDGAIIFANTRADTFMVTDFLKRHGMRAEVLNGDLPQKQRERTLKALRDENIDFLVATDVAARGIDISDLSHVFNYTLPANAEIYIHRTGRTGRAGKRGRAVSLISPAEVATLFDIKKYYKLTLKPNEIPTTEDILEAKQKKEVESLDGVLEELPDVADSGKLGIARQLLEQTEDEEELERRTKIVARLLAIADQVSESGDLNVRTQTAPPQRDEAEIEAKRRAAEEKKRKAAEERERKAAEEKKRKADAEKKRRAADAKKREADEKKEANKESSEQKSNRGNERKSSSGARRRRRSHSEDYAEDQKREGRRRAKQENGDDKKKKSGSDNKSASSSGGSQFPMEKMWVNMGRKDFDGPEDVVEMVCFMAGMDPEDLGKISLKSTYSYVEVREDYFYDIINAMNNQEWNGVTVAAEPARK